MKQFLVVAAFIALCSGSAVLKTPGDNSHYVEGQSRYFWMPDGSGVPQLVDLNRPVNKALLRSVNGSSNAYWLYTRSNPTEAQIIVDGDADTITDSNYNASNIINVIAHGWTNNGDSEVNTLITAAFLEVQDCNVIVLDWSELAGSDYVTATLGVPSVGEYLGNFLVWLIETAGGNWDNVHLVGHSLGAHVVGNAGRAAGGSASRVTGLDPAGPLWVGNDDALNTEAAQYVEAIHTDGGVLGYLLQIADADFYPNGGTNPQPGCLLSTCSHSRSYELFASTVYTDHLVGLGCDNLVDAVALSCSGDSLNMGNAIVNKTGSGIFGLTTTAEFPY